MPSFDAFPKTLDAVRDLLVLAFHAVQLACIVFVTPCFSVAERRLR